MKKLIFICLLLMAGSMFFTGCSNEPQQKKVRIAAAASLEQVFVKQLIPAFNEKYPEIKIEGTYDSSGKLQTQIENGLQADIFFSAAEKEMNALIKSGYVKEENAKPLLKNSLVLITNSQDADKFVEFKDIALADRPAIGDPESVPAGQYAREALQKLGVWQQVKDKASLGTNVTEVLYWVAEGSAQAGIVYATDAAGNDKVRIAARLPQGVLAKDVVYPVGLLQSGSEKQDAVKFYEFLQSAEAAVIFKASGFEIAG